MDDLTAWSTSDVEVEDGRLKDREEVCGELCGRRSAMTNKAFEDERGYTL